MKANASKALGRKKLKHFHSTKFSLFHLVIFILVFGGVGYLIFSAFAAGSTKVWNAQADFSTGTLSNTTATSDGHVTLTPSGGVTNAALPTYDYNSEPYTGEGGSSDNCYQYVWVIGRSPTTPYISPDSAHHAERYLLVNPNANDGNGHQGKDDWWFVFEHYFDTSTPSTTTGQSNSYFNLHNVAGDNGPNGGVGWGFGDGVSSIEQFFDGSASQNFLLLENNVSGGSEYVLPTPALGQWHQFVMHITFGRKDGTTADPGAMQEWMDGTKVVDVSNVNTLQKAVGPDSNTYVQQWVQLWQGTYIKGAPCNAGGTTPRIGKLVLARIGNNLSQALNDVPSFDALSYSTHISGQPNLGDSSASPSASQRNTSDFIVPSDLSGSVGATYPSSGTITLPFDAGATSSWTSFTPVASTPTGTSISYQYRSSTDNVNWSTYTSTLSSVPNGRYFQVQATLATTNSSATPSIDSLTLAYSAVSSNTPTYVSGTIANGDSLTGTKAWTVTTSGSVASVEFWANGTKLFTTSTTPYSYNLDTTTLPNGSNQLNVVMVGTDGSRVSAGSGGVLATVVVNNAGSPAKPGDLNNDNSVNIVDLSIMLSHWGSADATSDINHDGTVNVFDLSILLSHYGT